MERVTDPTTTEDLAARVAESGIPEDRRESAAAVKVGGCLSAHWRRWQAVGADSWTVSVLRDGYRLPFESPPPLTRTPILFPAYRPGSPQSLALRQEIEKMLAKGALEIVPDPGPGFYSRLFLVEKATGGWRPVIDLSTLNTFIRQTPFKMETVASVLNAVQENDLLASLDLKDAYFQVPVHPSSRKFLRFVSQGTVYQFRVLCFGLSTAPQVFTRVFAAVSAWAHSRGIRLLRYLDDWLVLASSETKARQHVQDLLLLCHVLGIVVNKEKSDLTPSRSASYLGMTIDTVAGKVSPSRARVEKFLRLAGNFVMMNSPPALQWEVLLGHLSSLEKLVPRGRLRLRSMQWQLKTSWSPEDDPPDLPVELTQEVREDLSWWTVESRLLQGVPFGTLPPGLLLFTDASCAGWGAHLLDQRAPGKWLEEEQMLHINLLEMKAVWLGLQSFQKIVTGHRVTVMCDNSTVVAYVSKQGGTHSRSMCELTSRLLKWTEDIDVHLEARYLPGQNNVLADLLSRRDQAIATEWTLHRQVAKALLSSWGSPSIDLFASRLNAQLPVNCSLVPDDQAALEDAFRHPWDNLDVYAFPPFALLGKVLSRVRQSRNCSMTGSSSLGRQGLVRGSTATADASTSRSASVGRRRSPAPQRSPPPRRPRVETSRVATVKQLLRKSGFSRGAASDMSRCVRESTSNVYQSKWLAFCNWCRGRGVAPVSASVPLIVDFFRHLVRDKGLSVPAVRGYRASLNSVFALKGRDLAASREVSMLFRSFSKTARPERLRPPNWDISLVLQSLTRAPYEPLRSADERFLAQKTLVLLALASAKRIGELHALSYHVSHSRAWGEVSFVFVPGFVAKTQDPSSQDPRFDSFTIPALPKARDNPNGRLLCPVRAVKLYLRRAAPHRPACERLFLTTGPNPKEIAKNTISFWLRKTIARAYELAGRSLPVPAPRARETRGIAPSLLYRKNFALPQVLSAGTWRRHTTFTRHYLRDLAHKSLDTYHLGPVVAAQALV